MTELHFFSKWENHSCCFQSLSFFIIIIILYSNFIVLHNLKLMGVCGWDQNNFVRPSLLIKKIHIIIFQGKNKNIIKNCDFPIFFLQM